MYRVYVTWEFSEPYDEAHWDRFEDRVLVAVKRAGAGAKGELRYVGTAEVYNPETGRYSRKARRLAVYLPPILAIRLWDLAARWAALKEKPEESGASSSWAVAGCPSSRSAPWTRRTCSWTRPRRRCARSQRGSPSS